MKLNQAEQKRVEAAEPWSDEVFTLIPEGWYQAELKEVQLKTTDNGTSWDFVFWQLADPESGQHFPGRQWWNCAFTDGAIGKLKSTYAAFDAPLDEETDNLIGEKVEIYIGIEIQAKGNRKGQEVNKPKAIRAVGSGGGAKDDDGDVPF